MKAFLLGAAVAQAIVGFTAANAVPPPQHRAGAADAAVNPQINAANPTALPDEAKFAKAKSRYVAQKARKARQSMAVEAVAAEEGAMMGAPPPHPPQPRGKRVESPRWGKKEEFLEGEGEGVRHDDWDDDWYYGEARVGGDGEEHDNGEPRWGVKETGTVGAVKTQRGYFNRTRSSSSSNPRNTTSTINTPIRTSLPVRNRSSSSAVSTPTEPSSSKNNRWLTPKKTSTTTSASSTFKPYRHWVNSEEANTATTASTRLGDEFAAAAAPEKTVAIEKHLFEDTEVIVEKKSAAGKVEGRVQAVGALAAGVVAALYLL